MQEDIRKNIFVMTRSLTKDYHWFCRPASLCEIGVGDNLISEMDRVIGKSYYGTNFSSGWNCINFRNNKIVFRMVIDGRTDIYSRLIKRYEGAVIQDVNPNNILKLEEYLLEKQKETDNYDYGFDSSLLPQKKHSALVKVRKRK